MSLCTGPSASCSPDFKLGTSYGLSVRSEAALRTAAEANRIIFFTVVTRMGMRVSTSGIDLIISWT